MTDRRWIKVAGLALCCWVANLLLAIGGAAAKDCGLTLLGSAEISIPHDGLVLAHVSVNAHPASMELDMSSVTSMIQEEYVQSLGLHNLPAPVHRDFVSESDSVEMTRFARLTSLEIGSVKFGNPPIWVLPEGLRPDAATLGTADRPDVGRIGVDVLDAVDFELDFANNRLSFYSTDHCPGAGAYWTRNYTRAPMIRAPRGNLIFPVELDGKKVEAVLSTAAPHSWMLTRTTRQLYGFDQRSDIVENDGGDLPAYYREMTLSGFGPGRKPVRIRLDTRAVDPTCTLTSRGTGAAYYLGQPCRGNEAALYLGMDVLRHLHLYYASKEQVLYFSAADAAAK